MEYLTGNIILGREGIEDIELSMEWFSEHFDDILIPLYTGTAFYSLIVSTMIYFLINWLWIKSVHKEKNEKKRSRKPKMRDDIEV